MMTINSEKQAAGKPKRASETKASETKKPVVRPSRFDSTRVCIHLRTRVCELNQSERAKRKRAKGKPKRAGETKASETKASETKKPVVNNGHVCASTHVCACSATGISKADTRVGDMDWTWRDGHGLVMETEAWIGHGEMDKDWTWRDGHGRKAESQETWIGHGDR